MGGAVRVTRLTGRDLRQLLAARILFDHAPSESASASYLSDARNIFLLATEESVPIGFLRGSELGQLHTERRQMFLYEIGVAPSHRRCGVGRILVLTLLEHCKAAGMEEAFVLTDPRNTAAVRLYRSTGAVTETAADRMYVYHLRGAGAPRPGAAPRRRGPGRDSADDT